MRRSIYVRRYRVGLARKKVGKKDKKDKKEILVSLSPYGIHLLLIQRWLGDVSITYVVSTLLLESSNASGKSMSTTYYQWPWFPKAPVEPGEGLGVL